MLIWPLRSICVLCTLLAQRYLSSTSQENFSEFGSGLKVQTLFKYFILYFVSRVHIQQIAIVSREKLVNDHLKLSLLNTKIAVQKATELVADHY